jgi:iron complex transport system substrate-binding protein
MMVTLTACRSRNNEPQTPTASVIYGRDGLPFTLPEEINTIVAIGPSNSEIMVALGFGDKIISADFNAANVEGLPSGVAILDMFALDAEYILNLNPDIIFITGLTKVSGDDDPLRLVSEAGTVVTYLPTSESIADIMEDIRFIAAVLDAQSAGERIIADMQAEIDKIKAIAATITQTRTVYFEISPAPWTWTFGSGTFLNEMIEIVGAQNVFAAQEGWFGVSDEALLAADPDVILTSVNFLDEPIAEIAARPGFNSMSAVQRGNIHQIDTDSSNRPSHHIIKALRQIAEAVFPEHYR